MSKYSYTDVAGYIKHERGLISPEKDDGLIAYKKQKEFYRQLNNQNKKIHGLETKINDMETKLDKILEILNGTTNKS